MRVAFDLSCINRSMGGYERYVHALLTGLVDRRSPPDILALTDRDYGPSLVPVHPAIVTRKMRTLPRFVLKVILQDQLALPLVLRHAHVDLVHSPVFAGIARAPRPYLLTLHDLIPLQRPETLSRSAAWYWRTILPRSVRRADRILTVSEFSRDEIVRHFDLPPERVRAIPLAAGPHFRPVDDSDTLAVVRHRYGLPDTFLLFVGIASPRKNLVRLVEAFASLPPATIRDLALVVAGPTGWGNQALDATISRTGLASHVRRIGVVPDGDLPALYSLARAAVSVSTYEGFALPALEALACGTPLLCSDSTAYPEVTGTCALHVDPYDVSAIATGLATILAGGAAVERRRTQGLDRAALFSWQRTANATLDVYRSLSR